MKKRNSAKLLTLVISCALLVAGILCISASAASSDEVNAEFKLATLNYGADVKIAYAIDINGAEAADVVLYLYDNADLSGDPVVSSFSGSYYDETYPVYYSYGIAAKDLADYVYAVPTLRSSGEAIGKVCRYSVAQYCYSVIVNPESDETLIALAEDLITYGASAQTRLIKVGNIASEPLVSEYGFVYTASEGVLIDGAYTSSLVAPEATFIPSYTGEGEVLEWALETAGGSSTVSAADAANGIKISAHTKVTPVFFKPESFDGGTLNTDTVTTTGTWTTNSAEIAKDPKDETNNVLKVTQTHGSGSGTMYTTQITLSNPNAQGNCYTFETKIYMSDITVPGVTIQDALRLTFMGSDGQRAAGYGLKADANGKKVYFSLRGNAVANTGINDFWGHGIFIEPNEWHTLRYELYATGDASTYITKIYIGSGDAEPICVAEVIAYTNALYTDISSFYLTWQKWDTNYTVYLDDISLVKSDKKFETSKPEAEPETFDAADASVYTNGNYKLYYTYTAGGTTPSIAKDPADAANNVLKVQRVAQGAAANVNLKPVGNTDSGSCYTFESKIYLAAPTNTGDNIIDFTFSDNAKIVLAVDYGATGTVYFKNGSGKYTDFNGNNVSILPKKWYDIKFELYQLGDGNDLLKIYIGADGDDAVCVAEYTLASASVYDEFLIVCTKNKCASALYLDDVMFTRSDKTFVSDAPAE